MNGDPHRVTVQGESVEGSTRVNSSLLVAGGVYRPDPGHDTHAVAVTALVYAQYSTPSATVHAAALGVHYRGTSPIRNADTPGITIGP